MFGKLWRFRKESIGINTIDFANLVLPTNMGKFTSERLWFSHIISDFTSRKRNAPLQTGEWIARAFVVTFQQETLQWPVAQDTVGVEPGAMPPLPECGKSLCFQRKGSRFWAERKGTGWFSWVYFLDHGVFHASVILGNCIWIPIFWCNIRELVPLLVLHDQTHDVNKTMSNM